MKKFLIPCVFVVTLGFLLNALNPDFSPIKQAAISMLDTKAQKENQELKEKVATLMQQTAKIQTLERENNDLKVLLDTKISKNYKKTNANVLSVSVADEIFITIDKGADHEIISGDIAVFGTALVGRVSDVYGSFSHVEPITAPDVSVGAAMSRTGALGYTQSSRQNFFKNIISLTLFGAADFAAAGDKILTSGLGSVFPKGLLIGCVLDSTRKDQNATIRTAVDFFSLHTVCVLSEVK